MGPKARSLWLPLSMDQAPLRRKGKGGEVPQLHRRFFRVIDCAGSDQSAQTPARANGTTAAGGLTLVSHPRPLIWTPAGRGYYRGYGYGAAAVGAAAAGAAAYGAYGAYNNCYDAYGNWICSNQYQY